MPIDAEPDSDDLTTFDVQNPEHRDALAMTAAEGLSVLRSTEAVLDRLRQHHGLDAGRDIAFDGLLIAADHEDKVNEIVRGST